MTSSRTTSNPLLEVDAAGAPLYQLKLSLVLYLDYAPGPNRARRVYEAYMARFGQHVRLFQSTSWQGPPTEWNVHTRAGFERRGLPDLQQHADWGYAFADGELLDYHMFMFHGFKPVTEPGKASFFRFEWPWNAAAEQILAFAHELADLVPFLSGTGGYILSPRPFDAYAHDRMYGLVRRYWGVEAWGLDTTVKHMLSGYKCPSWLTLIGDRLLERAQRRPLEGARELGARRAHGTIYQSRPSPDLIDRHKAARYDGERRIAYALLPLQIAEHEPFGGTAWTPDTTMDWLRRFSS